MTDSAPNLTNCGPFDTVTEPFAMFQGVFMTGSRPARRIQGIGALAVLLLALAGCTPGADPQQTPAVGETSPASGGTGSTDEAVGGEAAPGQPVGAESETEAGAGAGTAGSFDRTATLVVRPEGFTSASAFPSRAGWTTLGSTGRCTASSTATSAPDEDQVARERDISLVALADLLAGEPRASDPSSVSEVLATDGSPGEPRGTNAVLQEWTVERAGTVVRSRVLVRSVWSRLSSGEGLRESSFVAFECTGGTIDEAAWGAALAQVRLPIAGGETAGAWRDE